MSLLGIGAGGCYLLAIWYLIHTKHPSDRRSQWLGFIGCLIHAEFLHRLIDTPSGQILEKSLMASFIFWLALVISWLLSFWRSLVFPRLLLYSTATVSLAVLFFSPEQGPAQNLNQSGTLWHVLLSFLGVALLILSALQALSLILQDRQIKTAQDSWLPQLPPLEAQEKWLFQTLLGAFLVLSLGFLIGFWNETQLADHNIAFALVAWILCAITLCGRYRFGWRGKTTGLNLFACIGLLFLAYFLHR